MIKHSSEITDRMIDDAIAKMRQDKLYKYLPGPNDPFHPHDYKDSIRAAFDWLNAQEPRKYCHKGVYGIKHVIECWAGFYVGSNDVEVAIYLHGGKFKINDSHKINIKDKFNLPKEKFEHNKYKSSTYSLEQYSHYYK